MSHNKLFYPETALDGISGLSENAVDILNYIDNILLTLEQQKISTDFVHFGKGEVSLEEMSTLVGQVKERLDNLSNEKVYSSGMFSGVAYVTLQDFVEEFNKLKLRFEELEDDMNSSSLLEDSTSDVSEHSFDVDASFYEKANYTLSAFSDAVKKFLKASDARELVDTHWNGKPQTIVEAIDRLADRIVNGGSGSID